MFQNPSSAPSSTPPSDSSSPSTRNIGLPSQPSSSHQGQSTHATPSQLSQSYTPFVPRQQPNNASNGPPRSPQYPRQLPNGNGARPQGGQNGAPSAGLSSPRLGPHPHNGQPSPMAPQMQPQMHQMGMAWPAYYVSEIFLSMCPPLFWYIVFFVGSPLPWPTLYVLPSLVSPSYAYATFSCSPSTSSPWSTYSYARWHAHVAKKCPFITPRARNTYYVPCFTQSCSPSTSSARPFTYS